MTDRDCSTGASVQPDKQHLVGYVGSKRNARGEAVDLFHGAQGELRQIVYHRDGGISIDDHYCAARLDLGRALDRMLAMCKVAA